MVSRNDKALKQRLTATGRKRHVHSPVSQNHLIDSVATVIRRRVVADVESARYFSIMADETPMNAIHDFKECCSVFTVSWYVCLKEQSAVERRSKSLSVKCNI